MRRTIMAAAALALAAGWMPEPARAARELVCQAHGQAQTFCRVPAGSRVRLVQQLSSAPCIENRSWGVGENAIWVSRRCAARFAYSEPGDTTGAIIGGLIVGGIIGAIIGGALDDDHRNRPPARPQPLPGDREAAQICAREATARALARGAIWARPGQTISVEPAAAGTIAVRALLSVRYRPGGGGAAETVARRYRCVLAGREVRALDFY